MTKSKEVNMIFNNLTIMVNKGEYFIADGKISNRTKKYINTKLKLSSASLDNNLKDLFFNFLNTNLNYESSILKFYNTYGKFGIEEKIYNTKNDTIVTKSYETVKGFKKEVNYMTSLIKLSVATASKDLLNAVAIAKEIIGNDTENIIENSEVFFEYQLNECLDILNSNNSTSEIIIAFLENSNEENDLTSDFFLLCSHVIIPTVINNEIKEIIPVLEAGRVGSNSYTSSTIAPTVKAATYYELFRNLSTGTILRQCKNTTCNQWFHIIGNDTRKIYCSSDCAKLQAKRMQRARDKERNSIGDNTKG